MKRLFLLGFSLLLAIFAQYWLQQDAPGNRTTWEAAIFFGIAVFLFLRSVRGKVEPLALGDSRTVARSGYRTAALIVGGLALLYAVVGASRFTTAIPAEWGWTLHLSSVALILIAAALYDHSTRPLDAPRPSLVRWVRTNWLPFAALVMLMAAAAVLRLYRLDILPEGIWYDEAVNALIARDLLTTPGYHPFYLETTFHTAHHNYLVALAFAWLGEGIGNARLVSAVMGVLMVGAGWLLGYEYFQTRPADRKRTFVSLTMAFVLGAILVVVPWSLNYSRIAVNYVATPLFALLSVGLLLHALRTQRMLAWAATAISLALGLYFYMSFRLFAPVLPLFMVAVLIVHRREWRKLAPGLITITLAGVIATAPLLVYSGSNLNEFLERSRDTFIFKSAAEEGRAELLLDNAVTHLLMFNVEGDPNGRHNLPYRPMLDSILGGLFVLGFALCLWRAIKHPLYLLPLLWLVCTLLGGILTLPYEAPQSLRSNGALPAALLIAIIPIGEFLRLWERTPDSRPFPALAPALAVTALVPLCVWNFNAFFRDQINDFAVWNAFSTAESVIGRRLAHLAPEANDAWIMSPYIQRGDMHPSMQFLAPQWQGHTQSLNAWDSMPLVWNPEKDAWLFFDFDTKLPWNLLRTQYPNGDFEEIHPAFVDTVSVRQAHLTPAIQETARGAILRFYASESGDAPIEELRTQQVALNDTMTIPRGAQFAEWSTILRVPEYGEYVLVVDAPGAAELFLDESSVVSGTQELRYAAPLAVGNHPLRLRVELPASAANAEVDVDVALSWALPGEESMSIPSANLFVAPVVGNGLFGVYRTGAEPVAGERDEAPLRVAVDQQSSMIFHTTPVPRPFHTEWTGKVAIPVSGEWSFRAKAIDRVRLTLDGEDVLIGVPTMENMVTLPLEQGLHDITIAYSAENPYSRYFVEWMPPGGEFASIPNAALFPPRESWANVALPTLALPASDVTTPTSLTPQPAPGIEIGPLIDAPVNFVAQGLNHPVGIVVGGDGRIWVAESGSTQVKILNEDGEVERTIAGGDAPFVEPFDLAQHADGTLVVSDAGAPALMYFAPDGEFTGALATDTGLIDRARGIDVDDDGNYLIAQTPGQRIVRLDAQGSPLLQFPAWQNAEAQPVDVLALPNGETLAAVLGINMLVRYDGLGGAILALPLATANSMDAPHLARDEEGNLFITQPEERRILWYSPEMMPMGHWQLSNTTADIKPVGITVDSAGRIWFTDGEGGRVGWVAGPTVVQP